MTSVAGGDPGTLNNKKKSYITLIFRSIQYINQHKDQHVYIKRNLSGKREKKEKGRRMAPPQEDFR